MYTQIGKLLKTDWIKGLIMAILGAILTFLYTSLQSGWMLDWRKMLLIGITTGLSYLIKNFFSDEGGKFIGKV